MIKSKILKTTLSLFLILCVSFSVCMPAYASNDNNPWTVQQENGDESQLIHDNMLLLKTAFYGAYRVIWNVSFALATVALSVSGLELLAPDNVSEKQLARLKRRVIHIGLAIMALWALPIVVRWGADIVSGLVWDPFNP